jgi:hypothetical protein
MVRNFTIALVAALVFGSVGIASARVLAPSTEHRALRRVDLSAAVLLPAQWPCEQPRNKPIPAGVHPVPELVIQAASLGSHASSLYAASLRTSKERPPLISRAMR